jgi:hypothetical protein
VILTLLGVYFDRSSRARIAEYEARITAENKAEAEYQARLEKILADARAKYERNKEK